MSITVQMLCKQEKHVCGYLHLQIELTMQGNNIETSIVIAFDQFDSSLVTNIINGCHTSDVDDETNTVVVIMMLWFKIFIGYTKVFLLNYTF